MLMTPLQVYAVALLDVIDEWVHFQYSVVLGYELFSDMFQHLEF